MTAAAWPQGLTQREAADRLDRLGPNVLPEPHRPAAAIQLLRQFGHFFALLLWGAGALAIIGRMPQLGVAIFAVVVINGVFSFVQEYRAERAAAHLRHLLPETARVRRDGAVRSVPAQDLVVGDVVLLEEGDRVSADLRCATARGLSLDTSTVTGESVPRAVAADEGLAAGTFVVAGSGEAVVTATGADTGLADIARLAQGRRPPTPMERDIARLVRTIAIAAGAVGAGFFGLMLLLGLPAAEGFLFGIGVTVALVPEGLLPTITLALALGAQAMARQNALVRRLESVEALGATTFICTDKTGTLTQNRMNIVRVWSTAGDVVVQGRGYAPDGTVLGPPEAVQAARLSAYAARCTSRGAAVAGRDGTWLAEGDPMDAAIDALCRRLAAPAAPAGPEDAAFPFDARTRMSTSVRGSDVWVKGAPEAVLAACAAPPPQAAAALGAMTAQGLRVLAVARGTASAPCQRGEAERGLRLLGLLGFTDPPREGVADAIAACREAGVRVAMVTGDHPATASAIARQIGLAGDGSPVLTGDALPADDAVLAAMIDRDGTVIARVSPRDKLRIAVCLQSRGHIVAMTGDGVNDAPALRAADIGVAMGGSGTDVAREAADLVLLDDHFGTIVAAIRQGRATFGNARRFLTYHLTDNVAELAPFVVWALSGGRFPLALGVLQILALDLGTDTLPATALAAESPRAGVLRRPPVTGGLLNRTVAVRAFGVLGPTEAVVELLVFVAALAAAGWRPGTRFPTGAPLAAASGAAFACVVAMQLGNAFACRSTRRPPWRLGWRTNRLLLWAVAAEAAFGAACFAIPALASLLGHAVPPPAVLPAIAAAPVLIVLVDAGWKALGGRRRLRRGPK